MRNLRAALAVALLFAAPAAQAEPANAVVELFTSQGCSSCPPADAQLEALAGRGDIVALAYHVDYWDYLGWKDTFGSPLATQRQRAYAASHRKPQVYTPQFIVNGRQSVSSRDVNGALAASTLPISVDIAYSGNTLQVKLSGSSGEANLEGATVRLVTFRSKEVVDVARGENAGRRITYANVVTGVTPIGMWDGDPLAITLPSGEVMAGRSDGCAILVQMDGKGGPGPILGAAWILDPDS